MDKLYRHKRPRRASLLLVIVPLGPSLDSQSDISDAATKFQNCGHNFLMCAKITQKGGNLYKASVLRKGA